MSDEVETKTYEIETTDQGRFRVTVPVSWKVTFGAVVPTSKSVGSSYGSGGWGLRFWEAADKQRAVYSNVVAFHDVSIPTTYAAVRKFGAAVWEFDRGQYKAGDAEKGWKPADEIKPDGGPAEETEDDVNDAPRAYRIAAKRF